MNMTPFLAFPETPRPGEKTTTTTTTTRPIARETDSAFIMQVSDIKFYCAPYLKVIWENEIE